jgi:hypothetical protein
MVASTIILFAKFRMDHFWTAGHIRTGTSMVLKDRKFLSGFAIVKESGKN